MSEYFCLCVAAKELEVSQTRVSGIEAGVSPGPHSQCAAHVQTPAKTQGKKKEIRPKK